MKFLRFVSLLLLLTLSLATFSISVSASEVITVTFTKQDLQELIKANVDKAELYDPYLDVHVRLNRNWIGDYGASVNYEAVYLWTADSEHTAGNMYYYFNFPYSCYALSSTIEFAQSSNLYVPEVYWISMGQELPWLFSTSSKISYYSGVSLDTYNFVWTGEHDVSQIHIKYIGNVSTDTSIMWGIRSLSVTYDKQNFDKIVEQLEEQNIVLEGIQNALDDINSSIEQGTQDIIDNQDENTQEIIDNENQQWEDTYNPSKEDIDKVQAELDSTVDKVKEKLGIFTFLDDLLSDFLNLFQPQESYNTEMVFPAFSIDVQEQSYTVWEEQPFDIASIKDSFSVLFTALNFITVVLVYSALIYYLNGVFHRIFVSK